MHDISFDIVVPTIGRPSLAVLLESLQRARGPRPARVIVVDDRRDTAAPLSIGSLDPDWRARMTIVASGSRGPAAARNTGWRGSRATWIAFLDDDVVVENDWLTALAADVRSLSPEVAASYGRVRVPLPAGRKPTDGERNVAALATARAITADAAFRRAELLALGGFDERFRRAYREDTDIALRTLARGKQLAMGSRCVAHPVRPTPWWSSIRAQAGNGDDVLLDALHGADWRRTIAEPRGAFASHVATTVAAASTVVTGAAWLGLTARFAWRRIAPGPRTAREIATMAATSVAIPFAAVGHRLVGLARLRAQLADRERAPKPVAAAVLFDRDGTLIADVPFNADPSRVEPMPAARRALDRLRAAGVLTAVVSNQGGVGLGRLRRSDVDAINGRMRDLLGELGPVFMCTHAPQAGCGCRKPAPGLIHAAAAALGVSPCDCVVIGDIGADVEAAHAAGARAVLVPTGVTLPNEIAAAPWIARDLDEAAHAVLSGRV